MPADEQYDTPHHTVSKVGHHPTCWNNRKPFKEGYYAEDRYYQPDRRWFSIKIWVPHLMTTECQQPGNGFKPDAGCVGCLELKNG